MYPKMIEILQILGASSLMATPSEADFQMKYPMTWKNTFSLQTLILKTELVFLDWLMMSLYQVLEVGKPYMSVIFWTTSVNGVFIL